MIYRSPRPDVAIPDVSLCDHVLMHASERGEKPALIDGVTGATITYAELDEMSGQAASALLHDGLRPGEVVALISLNEPMWAVACYAILRAGGVVTLINPLLTAREINSQLQDSEATTVISMPGIRSKIADATIDTAVVRHYVLGDHGRNSLSSPRQSSCGSFPSIASNSLAALPYSSGTGGTSKGVMLSHRNLVACLEQHRACWQITESDVLCATVPLFHIYGFNVIMNSALSAGATLITLPRFELHAYLEIVERHRVTRGHLAPPILLALAQAPNLDDFDLSSMTLAMSGAAPLDADVATQVAKRTGIRIVQGYGMTETSPGTHGVGDHDLDVPVESVGKLLPCTEARVVDPATGCDVEPGQPGELWIRGPQVMLGYLGRPDATSETVTDAWLHTGDIVEVRSDNFYVIDRLKELIKVSGFQVAPAELEAVLLSHPRVRDVAVLGVPHSNGGEVPKAFVVRDGSVDADELLAWTSAKVATYKQVREIDFIDEVPKSPTGKILRRVLKDAALENEKGRET